MRLGNDADKEDFILLVEDSNRHPALRFLSEYPALVVLAAALLLWVVVKLRGPSFRGARPSGSSPVPKAVLGGASVDPTRGAQFVHDVRRTQWLEQQQAAYEAQAKQRAEAEEVKRKNAAEAARLQAQQARERREADPVPQPPRCEPIACRPYSMSAPASAEVKQGQVQRQAEPGAGRAGQGAQEASGSL